LNRTTNISIIFIFFSLILIITGYNIIPQSLLAPIVLIFIGLSIGIDALDTNTNNNILYSEKKVRFLWSGLLLTIGGLWIITIYIRLPVLTLVGFFILFTTVLLYFVNKN